jgi:hypothetical protein
MVGKSESTSNESKTTTRRKCSRLGRSFEAGRRTPHHRRTAPWSPVRAFILRTRQARLDALFRQAGVQQGFAMMVGIGIILVMQGGEVA